MTRAKRITFRLTDQEFGALQSYATRQHLTRSKALRGFIAESLRLITSDRRGYWNVPVGKGR